MAQREAFQARSGEIAPPPRSTAPDALGPALEQFASTMQHLSGKLTEHWISAREQQEADKGARDAAAGNFKKAPGGTRADAAYNQAGLSGYFEKLKISASDDVERIYSEHKDDPAALESAVAGYREGVEGNLLKTFPELVPHFQDFFERTSRPYRRQSAADYMRAQSDQARADNSSTLASLSRQHEQRAFLSDGSHDGIADVTLNREEYIGQLVKAGPRTEFSVAGVTYPADPTRTEAMDVGGIGKELRAYDDSIVEARVKGEFDRALKAGRGERFVEKFQGDNSRLGSITLDQRDSLASWMRGQVGAQKSMHEATDRALSGAVDAAIDAMGKGESPGGLDSLVARTRGTPDGDRLRTVIGNQDRMAQFYRMTPAQQATELEAERKALKATAPGSMPSASIAAMNLSPAEQHLYQHHLDELVGGGVKNGDGSTSTIRQITTEIDGKVYSIPTVWGGKILSAKEAVARARADGLDKYPAYKTEAEAQARYDQMHDYMAQDIGGAPLSDQAYALQTRGRTALVEGMQQAQKVTAEGLSKDPLGFSIQVGNVQPPPPIIGSDGMVDENSMKLREGESARLSQLYGFHVPPMTDAEIDGFGQMQANADPVSRTMNLARVANNVGTDRLIPLLEQMDKKGYLVDAAAGGVALDGAPDLSAKIYQGDAILQPVDGKTLFKFPDADFDTYFSTAAGAAFALNPRAELTVKEAAKRIYVADLARAGKRPDGPVDGGNVQAAFEAVLGGPLIKHSTGIFGTSTYVTPPFRGAGGGDFDRWWNSIDGKAVKAGGGMAGWDDAEAAELIRSRGVPVEIAQGVYKVVIPGSGPLDLTATAKAGKGGALVLHFSKGQ